MARHFFNAHDGILFGYGWPRAPGLHSARSEAERWRAIGVSALPYK
ncbi:hypothetical protein Rleg_5794 (plasmid) [Rhizobium leguminosarum bv. trifolii WSM1325]|uniref:Uncharacterized protein n=1 Tax=Rhizobium leguminosarum bv. trifolii (strain WSM1325) TaxID=395491 RepID=C6B851_RHILS|nr:hypothetical protein Rleg_5794 [Rhizobium leguminosarum bv. trifolii WSM1325]